MVLETRWTYLGHGSSMENVGTLLMVQRLLEMITERKRLNFYKPIYCCIQKNPSRLISKKLGRKDFSMEQLSIDFSMLPYKQKNSISITQ